MSRRDYKYCPISGHQLVSRDHAGRERLICPDPGCGFVHWNNPIPVVSAIVEHQEQVVLVRSHGWPDTWYGLVAGFLETGEAPEHGMRREIEEELGLTPHGLSFVRSCPVPHINQIHFVYHAEIESLDIRLCQAELSGYRIVPIAELRPWSRGTGPALGQWLASRGLYPPVAEFGKHLAPPPQSS